MATGDLAGNIEALRNDCGSIKYPHSLVSVRAEAGDPTEFLPLLSYVLLRFSRHVAQLVADAGYQLHGKTDQRFVEAAWKFVRDGLGVKTVLTPSQFLSMGFAERKLLLLRQVIKACKDRHNGAARKERLAALKGTHSEQKLYCADRMRGGSHSPQPAGKARPAPAQVVSTHALPPASKGDACKPAEEPAGDPAAGCSPGKAAGSEAPASGAAAFADHRPHMPTTSAAPMSQQCQSQLPCPPSPEVEQPRPLPVPFMARLGVQIPQPHGWVDTGQAVAAGGPRALLPAATSGMAVPAGMIDGASLPQQPHASLPPGPCQGGELPCRQPLPWVPVCTPAAPMVTAGAAAPWTGQCGSNPWASQQDGRPPLAGAMPTPSQAAPGCAGQPATAPALTVANMPPSTGPPVLTTGHTCAALQPWMLHAPAQVVAAAAQHQAQAPGMEAGLGQPGGASHPEGLPAQMSLLQAGTVQAGLLHSGMADHATRQLIEDLQLRLQLAEETALGARYMAEQVQDSMRARMAVLEGRVKFLEAGFCLQPLGAQQLQLPWGTTPKTPPHIPQHQHQPQTQQQAQPAARPASPPIRAHWLPLPQQQQQQQQRVVPDWGVASHTYHLAEHHHYPMFSSTSANAAHGAGEATLSSRPSPAPSQSSTALALHLPLSSAELYMPATLQPPSLLLPPPPRSNGGAASSSAAVPGCAGPPMLQGLPFSHSLEHAEVGGVAAGETAWRSFSSTTELISSMRSRFSEADEFLKSLQQH